MRLVYKYDGVAGLAYYNYDSVARLAYKNDGVVGLTYKNYSVAGRI